MKCSGASDRSRTILSASWTFSSGCHWYGNPQSRPRMPSAALSSKDESEPPDGPARGPRSDATGADFEAAEAQR